jgi:hypothetical protein
VYIIIILYMYNDGIAVAAAACADRIISVGVSMTKEYSARA